MTIESWGYFLSRIEADGSVTWSVSLGLNLQTSDAEANSIAVSPDGNIYIAGMVNQWFLKLNSSSLDVIRNYTLDNSSYSNGICWDSINKRLLGLVQTAVTNEIWIYDYKGNKIQIYD